MNIEFLYLLGVAIAGVVGFVFGKRHERKNPQTHVSSGTIPEFLEPKKRKKRKTKTTKRRSGPKRTYKKRNPVLDGIETAKTASEKASGQKVDSVVVGSEVANQIVKEKKGRKPRKPANVETEPQIA